MLDAASKGHLQLCAGCSEDWGTPRSFSSNNTGVHGLQHMTLHAVFDRAYYRLPDAMQMHS